MRSYRDREPGKEVYVPTSTLPDKPTIHPSIAKPERHAESHPSHSI